jgi:hypothetical protein
VLVEGKGSLKWIEENRDDARLQWPVAQFISLISLLEFPQNKRKFLGIPQES